MYPQEISCLLVLSASLCSEPVPHSRSIFGIGEVIGVCVCVFVCVCVRSGAGWSRVLSRTCGWLLFSVAIGMAHCWGDLDSVVFKSKGDG